jgi:hypothetical protein
MMIRDEWVAAWDALLTERLEDAAPILKAVAELAEPEGACDYQSRAAAVAIGLEDPTWAWPLDGADADYLNAMGTDHVCRLVGLPEAGWDHIRDAWLAGFELGYTKARKQHERDLLILIRTSCAYEFEQDPGYPFFSADYKPGEDADEALLRIFWAEKHASPQTPDEDVIRVLIHG